MHIKAPDRLGQLKGVLTAQALLAAPDDEHRFARSLAWRLRGWVALTLEKGNLDDTGDR